MRRPAALPPRRCRCAHDAALHGTAGACAVTLPAFEEEELPPWSCPCTLFAPVAGPWRWHSPTGSWTAVTRAAS